MSEAPEGRRGLTRRKFLVRSAAGVGVILGAGYLSRNVLQRYLAGMADGAIQQYGGPMGPQLWIEIQADNSIILHSPKVEMGQGVFTGLAQIAADELEADISQFRVVHATTASGNVDPRSTGGSDSVSGLWTPLREMAATMREMIRHEAAAQLGVDATSVSMADGVARAGERELTYGEIAASASEWTVPDVPPLKARSEYRFIGAPVARLDLRDKVMGRPVFGMDAEMPDMLYGSVVRPHQIGARFASADVSEAEAMPGVVRVVQERDFVGVVAESYTAAERAKHRVRAQWETDRVWQMEDIRSMLRVGEGDAQAIQQEGDVEGVFGTRDVIEAEYWSPIGAHAQLEPNGALAHVTDDAATVVISTQVPRLTRTEVAEALGLSEDQVDIRPTYLGGGFGRRLHTPNAVQAALLSRAVGRPVKCFLDRDEEFRQDTFRPPTHHVCRATLGDDGLISAIEHSLSSGDVMFGSPIFPKVLPMLIGSDVGAWRGGMIQYRGIPNYRAVSWRVKLPFATSWWRSLGTPGEYLRPGELHGRAGRAWRLGPGGVQAGSGQR